jgi:hypothetical protein
MKAFNAGQVILDTFRVTYFDQKAQQKLYLRLRLVYLTDKNLIKIVIMDEMAKKSNSIIEKMPPHLLSHKLTHSVIT